MNNLELKLTGKQVLSETTICIDDKPIKFKKNSFGNKVCNYQSQNNKVNLKVYKMLDVGGVLWFFVQLFFFLISIFGILDIHQKQRCLVIDFEVDIDLQEDSKITLQFNSPQQNAKACIVQTDLQVQEVSNQYILDESAKNTLKRLKWAKILLFLAVVITTVVVFITKF